MLLMREKGAIIGAVGGVASHYVWFNDSQGCLLLLLLLGVGATVGWLVGDLVYRAFHG